MAGLRNPNSDLPFVTTLFVKALRGPCPPKSHGPFAHSPIWLKTDLVLKLHVEKNFMISCRPGWELKSHFFDFVKKFIYHSNFVWQHSQILLKYSLYWVSRLSTLWSCLLCWFARAALPQLWEMARLKSAGAFIKTLCSFWDFLNKRHIMFLAGAHRVKNLHCVVVMVFILADKTTTLALCPNIRWLWSSILPNCLNRGWCSIYRDTIQCRSTSRKYFRLPCAWNSTMYFF